MAEEFVPIIDIADFETTEQEIEESNPNPEEETSVEEDLQEGAEGTPVEEDEDVDGTDDTSIEEESQDESGDPNLTAAADVLLEKGIIFLDNDEQIDSWDTLESKIEELPGIIAEGIIQSIPELGRNLIDYVITRGDQLTKEDLTSFYSTYLEDVNTQTKEVDLSSVELAREYLSGIYSKQDIPEVAVEATLNALEDEDDDGEALINEAKRQLEKEKKAAPKHEDVLLQTKQELDRQAEQAERFADEVRKELTTLKWSPNILQDVAKSISSGQANEVLTRAAYSSPKALIQLATLSRFYDEKTQEFNFDAFIKQVSSKETRRVKDNIVKNAFSSSTTQTRSQERDPNPKSLFESVTPVF